MAARYSLFEVPLRPPKRTVSIERLSFELCYWCRQCQVIALREIHSNALELTQDRLILHPFRHGRDAQCTADLADSLHHTPVHGIGGDLTDELAVDLQEVYR